MGYDQHIVGSAERAELRQFGRGSKRKRYHFEPAGELFNGLEVPAPARRFLDALAPLSRGGSMPPIVPSSCKEGAAVAPFRHRHLGNLNVNHWREREHVNFFGAQQRALQYAIGRERRPYEGRKETRRVTRCREASKPGAGFTLPPTLKDLAITPPGVPDLCAPSFPRELIDPSPLLGNPPIHRFARRTRARSPLHRWGSAV